MLASLKRAAAFALALCLLCCVSFVGCDCGGTSPTENPRPDAVSGIEFSFEVPADTKDAGGTEPVSDSISEHPQEPILDSSEPLALDGGADGGLPEGSPEGAGDQPPDYQGPKFTFRVIDKIEDVVPPKLVKVSFHPTSAKAGDIVEVMIEVDKDLSDVINATASLAALSGGGSAYVSTTYHPSKKAFVGRVRLSKYLSTADWGVQRLTLLDGANNPSVFLGDKPPLKGVTFSVTGGTPDTKAPTITNVSLDTTSTKNGGFISFSFSATDDLSGLSYLEATAENETTFAQLRSSVLYDPIKKKYVGRFLIPLGASSGTWKFSRIDASDQAGNFGGLNAQDPALQGLTFTVQSTNPAPPDDKGEPVLQALVNTPLLVNAGSQFVVAAKATDAISGVSSIQIQVTNAKGEIRNSFRLRYNAATELWEGTSAVNLFASAGIWRINQVDLRDVAGLSKSMPYPDLVANIPVLNHRSIKHPHLAFTVSSQSQPKDTQAPEIKGLNHSPGVVKPGQLMRFYARLEELGGGTISNASCSLSGPEPFSQRSVSLSFNTDTGFYEGNLSFSESDTYGEWFVSGCFLSDDSGNTRSVPGWELAKLAPLDISRATQDAAKDPFVVTYQPSGGPAPSDTTPPTMTSFHFVPGVVKPGEYVRIFAEANDASGVGVSSGTCFVSVVEGIGLGFDRITSLSFSLTYNPGTKLWEGGQRLANETVVGTWLIQRCTWRDLAGNEREYSPEILSGFPATSLPSSLPVTPAADHRSFLVQAAGSTTDTKAPELLAIGMAPTNPKAGDSVKVFAKISDQSDLFDAFCSLKPSASERPLASYGAAPLRWNPATQLWEGVYKLSSRAKPGVWSLAGCQIEDVHRNLLKVTDATMSKVPKLDAQAVVTRALTKRTKIDILAAGMIDIVKPTVTTAKWLPTNKVSAGGQLLLQIDARDADSGILRVEAQIESPTGKALLTKSLDYNNSTQRYEAIITFPTNAEDGVWSIKKIEAYDLAGNIASYTLSSAPPLKDTTLTLTGTTPSTDKLAPVIKSVKRSKAVVVAGTTFRVSVEASDDVSGVASVSMEFVSPSGKGRVYAFLELNPITKLYEKEVRIPKSVEDGVWKPDYVSVSDRAGRFTQISSNDPLLANVLVTVRGTTDPYPNDKEAPTIQNLEIAPAKVTAGQRIRITADAKDNDSGIARIEVTLESPTKARTLLLSLQPEAATGRYTVSQVIPLTAPGGLWKITGVTLVDRAGNTRSLDETSSLLK